MARIRVTLRYIEILDRKDMDEYGEFVIKFKASVPESGAEGGIRIPETGHMSISDHPSMNKVTINRVVFEGDVQEGQRLVLEASGEEIDRLTANDLLNPYRREFTGPPSSWLGEHTPWDEGSDDVSDPEQLGDWRFAFAIDQVS